MDERSVVTNGYKMTPEQQVAEIRQSFRDDPPSGLTDVVYSFKVHKPKTGTSLYKVVRILKSEVREPGWIL